MSKISLGQNPQETREVGESVGEVDKEIEGEKKESDRKREEEGEGERRKEMEKGEEKDAGEVEGP